MAIKVFISIGSATTPEQRGFIDGALESLEASGLSPRIMNENEWSHKQPLVAIKKEIKECKGAVVIAFTRSSFKKGIEIGKNGNRELENINLTTPWNQIEAAMAYSFDLPLLVVAEKGLKAEGLIEQDYDWNVYWTDLSLDAAKSESFKGFIKSWKQSVENFNLQPNTKITDPGKLTIGQLIRSMNVSQLWKVLAAIISLISAIAILAFKTGGGKWPWE
jgi:hypothetical protein